MNQSNDKSLYIISSGDIENYDIDALLTGKPGSNLEALFQQFRDEVHIPAKASEEYRTWERRLYLEYGYPEDGWRFSPTWFFAQWLIKYHGFRPQKYDEFYLEITDI